MAEPRSECVALVPEDTDVRMIHSSDERQPEPHPSRRLVLRAATCLVVLALALAFFACVHEGLTNDILRRRRPSEATARGTLKNSQKKNEELADEHCPGCTDPNYRCIYLEDLSYSQCVDCSPVGNWGNDCSVWSEPLRRKAVDTCGLACGDMQPPKGSVPVVEPYCHMGSMEPAYAHDRCEKMKDHSLKVSCDSKDPNDCGVELSSHFGTGGGLYTVSMQAGRGSGLSSKFYLYTYGFGKDRSRPWNEIAMEVLGKSCSPDGTQISTDLVGGPFDEAADYWARETSYQEFITVPFDACADWHEYSIDIASNNVKWVVDGQIYRTVDISGLDDLITALYQRDLQAHLTFVGQDETAGGWDQMGFLTQNTEEFPVYAWFANIVVPTEDEAASQSVDPYADVEGYDATSDDNASAAGGSGGKGSSIAEQVDHNMSRDNVQIFATKNISSNAAEALKSEGADRPRSGGIAHTDPEHDGSGDAGGTETTTYNAEQLEGGHSAAPEDDASTRHAHGADPGHPSTTDSEATRATTSAADDQEGSDTTKSEDDDEDRAEDTDDAEDTGDADGARTTTAVAGDPEGPGAAKSEDVDGEDVGHAEGAGSSKAKASSHTSSDEPGAPASGDGAAGSKDGRGERARDAGDEQAGDADGVDPKPSSKDEPKGTEKAVRSKGADEDQAGDAEGAEEEQAGDADSADPKPGSHAESGHPDAPDSKGTRTTTFVLQGSDAIEAGLADDDEAGETDSADTSEPDSDSTHTTTFPLGFLED